MGKHPHLRVSIVFNEKKKTVPWVVLFFAGRNRFRRITAAARQTSKSVFAELNRNLVKDLRQQGQLPPTSRRDSEEDTLRQSGTYLFIIFILPTFSSFVRVWSLSPFETQVGSSMAQADTEYMFQVFLQYNKSECSSVDLLVDSLAYAR